MLTLPHPHFFRSLTRFAVTLLVAILVALVCLA
jgi:hypothetical protein